MEHKETFSTFCFRCGSPLMKRQIAAKFSGTFIKYNAREDGGATFYMCEDCLEATDNWAKQGVRGAIERDKMLSENV